MRGNILVLMWETSVVPGCRNSIDVSFWPFLQSIVSSPPNFLYIGMTSWGGKSEFPGIPVTNLNGLVTRSSSDIVEDIDLRLIGVERFLREEGGGKVEGGVSNWRLAAGGSVEVTFGG